MRAPAYKAVHRDERPLPRVAGQGGGVVAGAAAQLVQDALGPACIKGIVPDVGGKVVRTQQFLRLGREAARHLAGSVVAELPALAEQLEVEVAPPHGGVKQPHPAAAGLLPQLQISVCPAKILHFHAEQQGGITFPGRHGAVHHLKVTGSIHGGSPLFRDRCWLYF